EREKTYGRRRWCWSGWRVLGGGFEASESEMGLRRTETKWVALLRKDCRFPTYETRILVFSETWDFRRVGNDDATVLRM
ncbi:hypothetical protein VIGAN_08175500, partial [Vigna angularis var. angularis]